VRVGPRSGWELERVRAKGPSSGDRKPKAKRRHVFLGSDGAGGTMPAQRLPLLREANDKLEEKRFAGKNEGRPHKTGR